MITANMTQLWIGPRGGETWVPAPDISGDSSGVTWNNSTQLLNGGSSTRSTLASHKEFSWTWSNKTRAQLRPLVDVASGKRGPGLIYFIDPMASDQNVLPEQWAFPAQAAYDAVPIVGDDRPEVVTTASNDLDYPTQSVVYDLTSGASRSLYVPIPPGYQMVFGWHDDTGGNAGVRVREVVAGGYGTEHLPGSLAVTDSTRFSDSYSGVPGVEIDLYAAPTGGGGELLPGGGGYPGATTYPGLGGGFVGSVQIAGMMAQIIPAAAASSSGEFISGQGNSGCTMSKPSQSPYSLPFDQITMSAKLIEQGDWE